MMIVASLDVPPIPVTVYVNVSTLNPAAGVPVYKISFPDTEKLPVP